MSHPARNTMAIVGAGPIGLETLVRALDAGFDAHVFEQGEVGAHPLAWGHVRMFTPWSMNVGPASGTRLRASGWGEPEANVHPTGAELAQRYLQPLARLPELKDRVHERSQVVQIGRRVVLKGDSAHGVRRAQPFRLLVRDAGGRENYLHAYSVVDASGVYANPNWAGEGGIPARNELYLRPQLAYHPDDVLDLRRARYAGRRTLVLGGGASAATTVENLVRLADEAAGTTVVWATRKPAEALYRGVSGDPLEERRRLEERARARIAGGHPAVTHVGGVVVESLEFNSATHRYRVTLRSGDDVRMEEVDQIVVNTGYHPDNSLHRELQVHECYATGAPMKLSAALLGEEAGDCLTGPAFGADVLANPEPQFFILGHKSYGRNPHFLLQTGYRQAEDVVAHLAKELPADQPA